MKFKTINQHIHESRETIYENGKLGSVLLKKLQPTHYKTLKCVVRYFLHAITYILKIYVFDKLFLSIQKFIVIVY